MGVNMTSTAPGHLRAPTRRWFSSVVRTFELDEHHLKLLGLAGEAFDRAEVARLALRDGLTFQDRFGTPRARPEVAISRNCMATFARLLKELGLDAELPTPKGYAGELRPTKPDVRRIHANNAEKQRAYRERTGQS